MTHESTPPQPVCSLGKNRRPGGPRHAGPARLTAGPARLFPAASTRHTPLRATERTRLIRAHLATAGDPRPGPGRTLRTQLMFVAVAVGVGAG